MPREHLDKCHLNLAGPLVLKVDDRNSQGLAIAPASRPNCMMGGDLHPLVAASAVSA
jgi:hypothetical protein